MRRKLASALADHASVREITVENARSTILSRIFRLRLTYDRITPDAPSSVILKTGLPERIGSGWNAGSPRSHGLLTMAEFAPDSPLEG